MTKIDYQELANFLDFLSIGMVGFFTLVFLGLWIKHLSDKSVEKHYRRTRTNKEDE